ncbi:CHAP domain-containing protein [Acetobacteraceae bacterium H6797]|nr:CHAP domain-containing protein [Acetobacteraceae bacterium H6797]
MRAKSASMAFVVLLAGASVPLLMTSEAEAARSQPQANSSQKQQSNHRPAAAAASSKHSASKPAAPARRQAVASQQSRGGISCVPYARMVTGMDISGNAYAWWGNAAGSYARGKMPEPGSVLAFRSSGGMRSGHVAVVSRVVSRREVLIDHANWEGPGIRKGTVMRGVSVIDASDNNDWSVVRVQVGHSAGSYGREYPTYGFIYNRRPGHMLASTTVNGGEQLEELAEAPSPHAVEHMNLTLETLGGNASR